jgi:hypothetical protein
MFNYLKPEKSLELISYNVNFWMQIIALGIPFGRVTNVLMLKGKSQVRQLWIIVIEYSLNPYEKYFSL